MKKLHLIHQGIEAIFKLVRDTIFLPNFIAELREQRKSINAFCQRQISTQKRSDIPAAKFLYKPSVIQCVSQSLTESWLPVKRYKKYE